MPRKEYTKLKILLKKIEEKYKEIQENEMPRLKNELLNSSSLMIDINKILMEKIKKNKIISSNKIKFKALKEDNKVKFKDFTDEIQNNEVLANKNTASIFAKSSTKEIKNASDETASMLFSGLSIISKDAPQAQINKESALYANTINKLESIENTRKNKSIEPSLYEKKHVPFSKEPDYMANSSREMNFNQDKNMLYENKSAIFDCDSLVNSLNSGVIQK